MTVQEIKQMIDALSPQACCELMALLRGDEDDDWDRQMAEDAEAGRLDFLMDEIDEAVKRGDLRDLPG